MSLQERKYDFFLPLSLHIYSFLPKTRWTLEANPRPLGHLLYTHWIGMRTVCSRRALSGHRGDMALPLGLAPANLKETFLTVEELDVAFNLWNRSWTWKPFWILTVQGSCVLNAHVKTGWTAPVGRQCHDFPCRHCLLKLWVIDVACCEAPGLVLNSSVLIQSYPCVPWYFIFNVIRSCDVSPS